MKSTVIKLSTMNGLKVFTMKQSGGEDPKRKELTYDQINLWSDFADKHYKKGMPFYEMWKSFKKANPDADIDPDVLLDDLQAVRLKAEKIARDQGITNMGHLHTGFAFPKLNYEGKDYGRMNRNMVTQVQPAQNSYPQRLLQKKIPEGVTEDQLVVQDGYLTWQDPKSGDIVYGEKSLIWTDPRVRDMLAKKNP